MADQLSVGRRIRLRTLVDNFSRESLAISVSQSFRGTDVAELLEQLGRERGLPESIRVDNGTVFTSRALDLWAYANGVTLDFSRPENPTDNALIESFNGRFRQEGLNQGIQVNFTCQAEGRSLANGLQSNSTAQLP